jgi:hypothetical protein
VLTAKHRTVRHHSPDSPVCTEQPGARSANLSLSGFSLATSAINHRTVRARRRTVRCSSRVATSTSANGHMVHRTVQCPTSDGLVPHRKGKQPIRGFSAAFCAHTIHYPVHHQTVRCTDEQKARIAYQMEFQRLLAALGL